MKPIIDSALLILLRIGFFLASRRFLLSTLKLTLNDRSTPESILPAYDDDPNLLDFDESPIDLETPADRKAAKQETKALNRAARILFSSCVSEACLLVTLVIFHSAGILSPQSRQQNFLASLYILLALILAIIPLQQCLLLTYRHASKKPLHMYIRLAISLLPFSLYVFVFTLIPPYVTSDTNVWTGWLAPLLGRVVVIGVIALAALSGYGASRSTWKLYMTSKRSTSDDISQAENSLARIRHDLEAKQAEQPKTTWSRRLFGDGELAGLMAMEREAHRSLNDMRERKRNHDYARTFQGRFYILIGYAFAIYCGARVLLCLPSLFFPTVDPDTSKGSNGDWISFFIAFALSKLPIEVDVGVWSRAISLAFTGIIILSSLSRVLRGLTRVLQLSSKSIGTGFLLLTLGQLFAIYVISLLVQLRTSIPDGPDDDSLLASLPDFRVFGRLFDLLFLATAASTLIYRFISAKIR